MTSRDAPQIESKGRFEIAKRLQNVCAQIFRYAIATARAERDVGADLRDALIAPKPVHRAAITSAENVQKFHAKPSNPPRLRGQPAGVRSSRLLEAPLKAPP